MRDQAQIEECATPAILPRIPLDKGTVIADFQKPGLTFGSLLFDHASG